MHDQNTFKMDNFKINFYYISIFKISTIKIKSRHKHLSLQIQISATLVRL